MPILVKEATDADIPRACEVETAAYANNAASPFLFPGPFPPDSRQQRINRLIQDYQNDPTVKWMKVVDEELGEAIAFAKWHIYDTSEKASKAERPLIFGEGSNKEACLAFFGGIAKKKAAIMGDTPHIYLHLLHTDPKFQGRGAGSALIRWGFRRADELGLPIYLESTPDGHKFYEKQGFEDIEVFALDLSKYGGGNEPHIAPLMLRGVSKFSE
ncbi:acyl-CoA N-acyltransferase [Lophiotrema nucula]|uniref:Acyl-CoA N-acyltransferase n=1 Tax=Lophiotrema nucula TaxID=690887 RepID=A0A6A5YXV4_9PLEO|nr:acyl-CoA N-acyltransferase [Lophiotrema nucula]